MEARNYTLDPNGDVVITLRNPNAPFAVLHEYEDLHVSGLPWTTGPSKEKKFQKNGKEKEEELNAALSFWGQLASEEIPEPASEEIPEPAPEEAPEPAVESTPSVESSRSVESPRPVDAPYAVEPELAAEAEPPTSGGSITNIVPIGAWENFSTASLEPSEFTLRVSSAHLRLASPYFQKALDGSLNESHLTTDGLRHMDAQDWDAKALLIVMQIIHGRNHHVPRILNLEMLAKVAVVVDYYGCHEMVEPFTEIWLIHLNGLVPDSINRDLILLLLVSSVFRWAYIFNAVTKTALDQAQGPLRTLNLPIQESIICKYSTINL
jgi:hypothetical protein